MQKTISRWVMMIVLTSILIFPFTRISAASSGNQNEHKVVTDKVLSVIPESIQMTDRAIDILSRGLNELSSQERDIYEKYFDPGNSGAIDEDYTAKVVENFRKIRSKLANNISLIYEVESSHCELMTLYYTDFVRIHICPYAAEEMNLNRMARGIIHEAAHIAFLAFDRSYYYPNYSVYNDLNPEAHPATHIPLVGYVIREVLRNDTLYNADTYAKFAAEIYSAEAGQDLETAPVIEKAVFEETFSPEVRYSDKGR